VYEEEDFMRVHCWLLNIHQPKRLNITDQHLPFLKFFSQASSWWLSSMMSLASHYVP
jgi:hypothetical protein